MDRRRFLSSSAAAGALAGAHLFPDRAAAATQPNILFIHVDEMRFPSVFPAGIESVDQFLAQFMPNTFKLWQAGVKFANHQTAASACSPSRAAFTTGLYTQQTWVTQTVRDLPGFGRALQPSLKSGFPTYGSLLRQAGYKTPYFGKWHLSIPQSENDGGDGLSEFGFSYKTYPDPTGANLQGTVGEEPDFHSDAFTAKKAANWLSKRTAGDAPWCLTVGFINPHDKAFFWGGTEYKTYGALFQDPAIPGPIANWAQALPAKDIPWSKDPLKEPLTYGYPALPPNWEAADQLARNKPSTQTTWRLLTAAQWGGISEDPQQSQFTTTRYPTVPAGRFSMAYAPYSYWQRNLDLYTQAMTLADVRVGEVIDALPPDVASNTVVVFTSDHGDYAGAHGFTSDKMGSCYKEITNVPLIVVDPTGRFAGDIDIVRDQLTSSIDLVPMLVTLGHGGSSDWMTGALQRMYGRRHNMMPLLRSAGAKGRGYALFISEELAPSYSVADTPPHIIGLITNHAKLGVYSKWVPGTGTIDTSSIELEFYDHGTAGGRAELDSTPDDPRAAKMLSVLLTDIIPNELQAPLPGRYGVVQAAARKEYVDYESIVDRLAFSDLGFIIGL
jgi:uncharacterized sulfatase